MSATKFPHPPHLPLSLRRGLSLAAVLAGAAVALAVGPAAAQSASPQPVQWTAQGTAQWTTVEIVDPADVGIRLATADGGRSVERWRRDRRRAEAAYWAALPEEPPVVGPPADRENRLP